MAKTAVMIKTSQILLTMALSKVRACLVLFLLLALLVPTSLAWADPFKQPSWKKNVKAGVELGFGLPWAQVINEKTNKNFYIGEVRVNSMTASPNWRFGVIGGYGFPFSNDTLAVGLDVGLFLGTKRNFEISYEFGGKLALKEQYLHIPFALKLATFDKEKGVQETGLTLGYELNVLLSSTCSLSGNYNPAFDQLESTAKSSKLGGSIFLGGKIDLFAGCYLMGQFKLPITDFLSFKDADSSVEHVLYTVRTLGTPLVELSLGFNIMKWL
jgi:hypothetical protein